MPVWKTLLVVLLGFLSLGLALATIVVPVTIKTDDTRWVWFGCLLGGTVVVSTLLILFLRHADKTFKR